MTNRKTKNKSSNDKNDTRAEPAKKNKRSQTKVAAKSKSIPVTPPPEKFVPRPLCFTNIDTDIVCPYYFIQNLQDQKYPNAHYICNIFMDSKEETEVDHKRLLKSLCDTHNIKLNFFDKNFQDISNHFIGFINNEHKNYNIFLYLDPTAIYFKDYVHNILVNYKSNIDVSTIKFNQNSTAYNYLLNNKSLDILLKNKSMDLDSVIKEYKLSTKDVLDKTNSIIYRLKTNNNHSDATVSKSDQKYKLIDDDFFTLCVFEHHFWSSFVYLNKRNHRMYNVFNDDHGGFEIQENSIKIQWDTWGEEIFYKKNIDDETYYYSVNP